MPLVDPPSPPPVLDAALLDVEEDEEDVDAWDALVPELEEPTALLVELFEPGEPELLEAPTPDVPDALPCALDEAETPEDPPGALELPVALLPPFSAAGEPHALAPMEAKAAQDQIRCLMFSLGRCSRHLDRLNESRGQARRARS